MHSLGLSLDRRRLRIVMADTRTPRSSHQSSPPLQQLSDIYFTSNTITQLTLISKFCSVYVNNNDNDAEDDDDGDNNNELIFRTLHSRQSAFLYRLQLVYRLSLLR